MKDINGIILKLCLLLSLTVISNRAIAQESMQSNLLYARQQTVFLDSVVNKLEDIFKLTKGFPVVIDLWATWCQRTKLWLEAPKGRFFLSLT